MKKENIIKSSILLIAGLLTALHLSAGKGNIKGTVTNAVTGTKAPGITVKLLKDSAAVASTVSDAKGNYAFIEIADGIYSVIACPEKFPTVTQNNIIVRSDKTSVIDITIGQSDIVDISLVEDEEEIESIEYQTQKVAYEKETSARRKRYLKPALMTGAAPNVFYESDAVYVEHNTEEYDVINENKFKYVNDAPLSTFSADVDRAAYANVRRMLNSSLKPVKDAVRIEEMINYFDYDYPQPTDGHPFSVNMEYGECPWNTEHKLALIGIQGKEMQSEEIPASNLVFLIDVSGSMSSENKLGLLKKSFKILTDKLRAEDRVSIVVYAGAAGVVLPSTAGDKKETIMAALDKLQAGGSTAGGEGIELAYDIARKYYIENGNNRIILATDGDFNVGASSNAEMVRLIEKEREAGVFLTILGFGMGNYKDSKMEVLSNAGNGNYAYIDNILEAKKVFGNELWGTLFTIAKDVKIQVEFNPAKVKAYRLIGYENRLLNDEDFNDDKKDAGEIGCGHTVTALYEIIPADSDEKLPTSVDNLEYQQRQVVKSDNVMTVKLRYKEPDGDTSKLIEKRVKDAEIDKVSDNIYFAASVAEFGMLLRDSEYKADANYDMVKSIAKQAMGDDAFGYKAEFINLVEKAELLR